MDEISKEQSNLAGSAAAHEKTESTWRESQARLLAIGKALPDLVFVLDEDERHTDFQIFPRISP
jgi:hypothetical protein